MKSKDSKGGKALFLALFIIILCGQAQADFVTFQADNQRSGNVSGPGPKEANLLWSTSLTGHGYVGAGAVVSGDRIFVSNWPDMTFKGDMGLVCLNSSDGTRLWINALGGKGAASTPALEGDRIFTGSYTGDIYCIDIKTGETLWSQRIEPEPQWWGVASSPLVQDDVVYVMSFSDGNLHALSQEGKELWNLSTGQVSPFLSAAASENKLYVPGGDPAIYCLDAASGKLLWKQMTSAQITATPTLAGDVVYLVTADALFALDSDTGEQLWIAEINGTISSPGVSFGRIFLGSDDSPAGHMNCFDAKDGSLLWMTEVNGPVKSSPLVIDGLVYFSTSCEDGIVCALDASNGSVRWSYPVNAFIMSSASASDGTLYMGSDDGRLYAFGTRPKGLLWKGEVLMDDTGVNITADSGKSYQIKGICALSALVNAANKSGQNLEINDSLYDLFGLQIESIGDIHADGENSWRFWINYPDEAVPTSGPDLIDLNDGDRAIFYFGDRRSKPEDSPRLEITAQVIQRRPEALFLTVGGQSQIKQASNGSVLNVTILSPENATNLSSYELIFIEMIDDEAASSLAIPLQKVREKDVPIIVINSGVYENLANVNLTDHPFIQQYWDYGQVENMRRLFTYLAANFCGLSLRVLDPLPTPTEYIYHPNASDIFENITDYLSWYAGKDGYKFNSSAPTIGVLSYYQDLDQPDRSMLIRAIEDNGANAIDLGISSSSSLRRFFAFNNTTIIDAAVLTKSFRLNYGDPDQGIADLQKLNVPVLRGLRLYYQTAEEWSNSTGIEPTEIYFQIALPEMDGAIEPIVISARNESGYQPIRSQIEWLADRAVAWADLGRINNSAKKVALIYYNHGGGKDNIEGCYINVPRSLQNILDGLLEDGYSVNGTIPEEKALVDLLVHQGTNVGSWAPGELDAMVRAGNATLLPAGIYEEWFHELPQDKQEEVTAMWGPPPGEIMVYVNQSGKYMVIPKLSFGNVILLPQPSRGWLENNTVLYHSKDIPPHHQYIAFYLWLKKGFGADAIVHLGKHGTEEWLPGKECGISIVDSWPALLIQDIPVVYPYIVDNIAEGTQAKRRGDAVMITHLTPPIVASGLYGNLTNLEETVFQYKNVENASVKEGYKLQIINISREMHLDEDLNVDAANISSNESAFNLFADDLERYLYELKSQFMPYGLHVFGQPPVGEPQMGLIRSMLGDGLLQEVAALISYYDYPNPARLDMERLLNNSTTELLTEVMENGTSPEDAQMQILGNASENLTALLNLSLHYADDIAGCSAEVPGLTGALESNYTQPSPADDPIRDPTVLPTGRNFRSVDPRRVPTEAAWQVGNDLAEKLVNCYRTEHNGSYPEKMAIVLWAWAMTDHGVVESEILSLVGARPVYDAYGGVTDVQLIPLSELGRPRIDVVVVPSGLHRDLFPEKLQLLDRAIRLAANDTGTEYPNYIKENSEELFADLMKTGNVSEEEARILSASRIFLEQAGTYGPNLDSPISASNTWENDTKLGNLFIKRMSYIYGDGIWSSKLEDGRDLSSIQTDLLKENLAEVEAVAQHTNSNLYGLIDNDDVYQYLGGIGLAVRTLTGKTPDMYVTDGIDPDESRVSSLHEAFSKELRSRYYNPQWMKGMMEQGYSGAREMDKFAENLWGWETTLPDLVSENTWSEVQEIYVQDKYQMGLDKFFDENNPWASQALSGRLIETARKDRWHPTDQVKQELVERYEQSVQDYGVTCCHHTCGNLALQEYMQGVLPTSEADSSGGSGMGSASKSKGASSHHKPKESKPAESNQTQSGGVGHESASSPNPSDSAAGEVKGYVMQAVDTESTPSGSSAAPLLGIGLVLAVLSVIWMGFRRSE